MKTESSESISEQIKKVETSITEIEFQLSAMEGLLNIYAQEYGDPEYKKIFPEETTDPEPELDPKTISETIERGKRGILETYPLWVAEKEKLKELEKSLYILTEKVKPAEQPSISFIHHTLTRVNYPKKHRLSKGFFTFNSSSQENKKTTLSMMDAKGPRRHRFFTTSPHHKSPNITPGSPSPTS